MKRIFSIVMMCVLTIIIKSSDNNINNSHIEAICSYPIVVEYMTSHSLNPSLLLEKLKNDSEYIKKVKDCIEKPYSEAFSKVSEGKSDEYLLFYHILNRRRNNPILNHTTIEKRLENKKSSSGNIYLTARKHFLQKNPDMESTLIELENEKICFPFCALITDNGVTCLKYTWHYYLESYLKDISINVEGYEQARSLLNNKEITKDTFVIRTMAYITKKALINSVLPEPFLSNHLLLDGIITATHGKKATGIDELQMLALKKILRKNDITGKIPNNIGVITRDIDLSPLHKAINAGTLYTNSTLFPSN